MESLRYLISFFLKVAIAFFIFAFVWWVVSIFFPGLSVKAIFSSTTSTSTPEGWLPSPRKYSSLLGRKATTPDANTNVFTPGAPYNGYTLNTNQYAYTSYNYVTYVHPKGLTTTTLDGREVTDDTLPQQPSTALLNNRSLTVRNLSIYEGGHVYTGLSFIGEAKENMFRDGKFPIVVVDQTGRVIGVSAAVASTDWAVPGWVRFQTKIFYTLPQNVPCTMIFEEALTQAERATRMPLRVPIQVRCN
jgi:hypothetical protein